MFVFVICWLMQVFLVMFFMLVIVFFGVNIVGDLVYMFVSLDVDQVDIEVVICCFGLDWLIWD